MRRKKLTKFLKGTGIVLLVAGGIAGCTFLFSTAYDIGVRTATYSPHNSSAKPTSSAGAKSSSSFVSSKAVVKHEKTEPHINELVLVGPDHPTPSWYKVKLSKSFGFYMDASVVKPFAQMRTDASKDGVSIWISSAYRSNDRQSVLFQQEIEQYAKTCPTYADAVSAAEKSVAKPGCSEHATGLALDLNGVKNSFGSTAAYHWLEQHAQAYGFIIRYPKEKQDITKIKFEPWHFRYVGVENAKAMKKSGMCLEEYVKSEEESDR